MENEEMLGKFFICEAPKNGKYVKAINIIREYEDGFLEEIHYVMLLYLKKVKYMKQLVLRLIEELLELIK